MGVKYVWQILKWFSQGAITEQAVYYARGNKIKNTKNSTKNTKTSTNAQICTKSETFVQMPENLYKNTKNTNFCKVGNFVSEEKDNSESDGGETPTQYT